MNYRVNLLPVELQPKPPLSAKKFLSYLLCTLVFALFGFGYGYFQIELNSFREELQSLQQNQEQLQVTQARLSETSKQQQAMKNQINTFNHLMQERSTWPKFLYDLNERVPEGVWLAKLNLSYIAEDETESKEQQNEGPERNPVPGKTEEIATQPASPEPKNPPSTIQQNQNGNPKGKEKTKVPEFAPNTAVIEGGSYSLESIGKFIYSLNQLKYLSEVELIEIVQDDEGKYTFKIEAPLKEAQP